MSPRLNDAIEFSGCIEGYFKGLSQKQWLLNLSQRDGDLNSLKEIFRESIRVSSFGVISHH